VFAQTGFTEAFYDSLSGDLSNSDWTKNIYIMLALNMVLFVAGFFVQVCITGKDHSNHPEDDGYSKMDNIN